MLFRESSLLKAVKKYVRVLVGVLLAVCAIVSICLCLMWKNGQPKQFEPIAKEKKTNGIPVVYRGDVNIHVTDPSNPFLKDVSLEKMPVPILRQDIRSESPRVSARQLTFICFGSMQPARSLPYIRGRTVSGIIFPKEKKRVFIHI